MRKALLTLPFLLAGCVNDSASYYINGNDNTLTLVDAEGQWPLAPAPTSELARQLVARIATLLEKR